MSKERKIPTIWIGKSISVTMTDYKDESWRQTMIRRYFVDPITALWNRWQPGPRGIKEHVACIDRPYYDPFKGERTGANFRVIFTDLELSHDQSLLQQVGLDHFQGELQHVNADRDQWMRRAVYAEELLRNMNNEGVIKGKFKDDFDYFRKEISPFDAQFAALLKQMKS